MRNIPMLMVIASVLAGLGIVQMSFLIGQGVYRSYVWTQEKEIVELEVTRLQRDLRTLREVRQHVSDPAYLVELARCQGFVGGLEKVVVDEQATEPEQGNCEPIDLP